MAYREGPVARTVDLAALLLHLEHEAPVATAVDEGAPKVYAALALQLRAAGAEGISREEFDALTADFGQTHWSTLRVAVAALERPDVREAFRAAAARQGARGAVARALVESARDLEAGVAAERAATHPLTRLYRAIGRATDGRSEREWLARMVLARLGAAVAGEPGERSREWLSRRDYARVYAAAAAARAEDKHTRWAKLAGLNADVDVRFPPRGKW